ncbi:MAG: DnaJ domain-containing protein [Planctomycetia bacterium]|nr:DnaJ domain-containing protein [Planctomycetia bacterium]
MAKNDYYKTLGVSKSASAEEIRKAHKKLSKKYHPDVNKESDASEQFKQVQEAFDVLGDAEKRQQYDRFGHVLPGGAGAQGQPFNWGGGRPGRGACRFLRPVRRRRADRSRTDPGRRVRRRGQAPVASSRAAGRRRRSRGRNPVQYRRGRGQIRAEPRSRRKTRKPVDQNPRRRRHGQPGAPRGPRPTGRERRTGRRPAGANSRRAPSLVPPRRKQPARRRAGHNFRGRAGGEGRSADSFGRPSRRHDSARHFERGETAPQRQRGARPFHERARRSVRGGENRRPAQTGRAGKATAAGAGRGRAIRSTRWPVVSATASRPRRARRLLNAGLCLCVCLAACGTTSAAPTETEPDDAPATVPVEQPKRAPIDPVLKQKTLQQAFTMLAAIIIGGVLLLLVVVMWGNRTRRFARKPLPNVARRDELWFLKPKPAGSAEPEEQLPTDEPPAE